MDDWDFPWIGGTGSLHDLRDADDDPRNTRLVGLRSVSAAAARAMGQTPAKQRARRVGFHIPGRKP